MNRVWVWLLLAASLALAIVGVCLADDVLGTTKAELIALKLPTPSSLTVAVLPFSEAKNNERHIQLTTSAVALNFMRCGFQFAPALGRADADSLAATLVAAQKAVVQSGTIAPDEGLRRGDAVSLGKVLGADWVVYGDILEVHIYSKWMPIPTKKVVGNVRVKVVDVGTGQLVMTRQWEVTETVGLQTTVARKGTSAERRILTKCVNAIHRALCESLSPHEHLSEDEVTQSQVFEVEEAWNRLAPRKSD